MWSTMHQPIKKRTLAHHQRPGSGGLVVAMLQSAIHFSVSTRAQTTIAHRHLWSTVAHKHVQLLGLRSHADRNVRSKANAGCCVHVHMQPTDNDLSRWPFSCPGSSGNAWVGTTIRATTTTTFKQPPAAKTPKTKSRKTMVIRSCKPMKHQSSSTLGLTATSAMLPHGPPQQILHTSRTLNVRALPGRAASSRFHERQAPVASTPTRATPHTTEPHASIAQSTASEKYKGDGSHRP